MTHAQRIALDRMLDAVTACCARFQDKATAYRVASLRLRLGGFTPAEAAEFLAPARKALGIA